MADAKLAPKMQEWQVDHTNLYLASGGKANGSWTRKPSNPTARPDTRANR